MPRFRPHRSVWWMLAVVVLIVLLRSIPLRTAPSADPQQLHRVSRVIDGDTLLLAGGERIRLIGVNTPELARDGRPAEPLAAAARDFLQSVVEGREISLGFDREEKDKYGRRLAYVYLRGRLINEEIIRAGFSRAETRFDYHDSLKTRFRRAEQDARAQHRGMWTR